MNYVLWTFQVLLACLFLFAGVFKLVVPIDEILAQMQAQMPGAALSGPFLQFIGVCETLGALGLILPGLLHVKPGLTPLAAAGLVIIMLGATALSVMYAPPVTALAPFVVGLVAVFVAYGRWRLGFEMRSSKFAVRS